MSEKHNLKELGYGQDAFYEVEGHDVFTMNTSEEHDMSLDRIYITSGGQVIKEVIVDGEVISRAFFTKEEIIAISEKILERDPEERNSEDNFTWKDFHVGAEN